MRASARKARILCAASAMFALAAVSGAVGASGAQKAASGDAGTQPATHDCALESFAACAGDDFTLNDVHDADLRGADLRGAGFNAAFLHGAALAGADLRAADLRGATLTGADLRGANLDGANLAEANLVAARVGTAQLSGAYLCGTTLPNEERSDADCGAPGPRLEVPASPLVSTRSARSAPAPDSRAFANGFATPPRAKAAKLKSRKRKTRVRIKINGPGKVIATAGGIECPDVCKALYKSGRKVVFTAEPDPGATFDGWKGRCTRKGLSCKLRVHKPSKLHANFTGSPDTRCLAAPNQDSDLDTIPDCREIAGSPITIRTPSEVSAGTTITRVATSDPMVFDTDGDGINDGEEFAYNGDPRSIDTDIDRLGDKLELVTYRSDLDDADTDGDSRGAAGTLAEARLYDGNEVLDAKTSPRNPDTDGDSLTDRHEIVVGNTNPRIANLPRLELTAVPSTPNVKIDLPYTVTETTGTEDVAGSTTAVSNGQTSSNGGSRETTNTLQKARTDTEKCNAGLSLDGPSFGCSASSSGTTTSTHSTTVGSTWGFANSSELSQQHATSESTSATRQVTFAPSGCIQVLQRLRNTGGNAVTVGDFQVLATTPDPKNPGESALLATLQPVNGGLYGTDCPATDDNFPDKTIPAGGSVDIGFAATVPRGTLRSYQANPTPIQFELGAISMTGTNLAGTSVNFLGDVATKVTEQDADVQVDFGNGTVRQFSVAAGTVLDANGAPAGITLGEALGPGLGNFSPVYDSGTPSRVSELRNPAGGLPVANDPDEHSFWNLVGDADGVGNNTIDWAGIVLKPGDTVNLAYRRWSDSDMLDDTSENGLGTDPLDPDTDDDVLSDSVEVQEGWVVPLAKNGEPDYQVYSSPLSCDVDGDLSPDGPGPGIATDPCPDGFGPESTRADDDGGGPPPIPIDPFEGTDPNVADTNSDGLTDGVEIMPDALRPPIAGGRVPTFLREWGGTGGNGQGTFQTTQGLAVDQTKPMVDPQTGFPLHDVSSYVINRRDDDLSVEPTDEVQHFRGNPLIEVPVFEQALLPDTVTDLGVNSHLRMAAVGIAAVPNTRVTTLGVEGPAISVNYYPKSASQSHNASEPIDFITTFNGESGLDINGDAVANPGPNQIGFNNAFEYGNPGDGVEFDSPLFSNGRIGNGMFDHSPGRDPIIGFGQSPGPSTVLDPHALPSEIQANSLGRRVFGTAATNTTPASGKFLDPSGVAVDRTRADVYVADDLQDRVEAGNLTKMTSANGNVEAFLGGSSALEGVRGIAVDPGGKYVYAAAGAYIYKLSTSSLAILGRFGGPGTTNGVGGGAMTAPWDIDIDAEHGAWVTDSTTDTIQYFYFPFGPD